MRTSTREKPFRLESLEQRRLLSALTVSGAALSGNAAYYAAVEGGDGGAIFNSGTLIVSNSTLSGNFAAYGPANGGHGEGGAILNSGTLTVSGSTISGNTAQSDGGAI